ncbi:ATP-binding cassette domain-containing protein [Micromonospora sp. NPDC003776]
MTADPELAISATDLAKTYGEVHALDGLNLSVPAGTTFSVLGPNGAGKTTAIKIMTALLRPDSGSVRVLGHDVVREPDAVRRRIALTGQTISLDEDLSGLQNLILAARLKGLRPAAAARRAGHLIEAFDLTDASNRLLKTYSGGQRRRVDIAASLVVTPELLFLDEPTTGLDPHSRADVWKIIRALVAQGSTVLLTTQYLEEADQLSDRVALIDHGRTVAEGTPAELKSRLSSGTLYVGLRDHGQRAEAERVLSQALNTTVTRDPSGQRLSVPAADPQRALQALDELARAGVEVSDFSLDQPPLDEVFLALTGRRVQADDREEVSA